MYNRAYIEGNVLKSYTKQPTANNIYIKTIQ